MPVLLSAVVVLADCERDAPTRPSTAVSAQPAPTPLGHVRRRAAFSLASTRLAIEDVRMSTAFDDVLLRTSSELVVNGGFFDGSGEPLGLAVSDGKALSQFSPRMSGGVFWIREGIGHLSATEEYEAGAVDFAIQCRPRLVVETRVNIRSDDGLRARRTAICLRDRGRTVELFEAGAAGEPGPTLFELAAELVDDGCEEALNLDGGPSTGWASRQDGGIVFDPPRGAVRHVVVVVRAR